MSRMVVASYCTTFLKKEMRHIYRQVTGLKTVSTFVMTKSRENADEYPLDDVEVLPRPRINFLARFHKKYIARMEPVFYRGEYDQLDGVLARRHADLLHVYFGHTGVHLLPFIRNWPRPSVVSFHGMDIMPRDREPGYNAHMRELLTVLPMVLARSESLAERLVELGCDRGKIRINRTSVPMERYPFSPHEPPRDGAWVLVQTARFIEKKGIDVTLRAFADFRRTHPSARLVLAGEGPLEKPLRALVAELGISPAVEFPGFQTQTQLAALYARAHVFVHPSRMTSGSDQEGVPNAMLEAMASGLPVVATRHGGIPEAVEEGRDGLLVPESDPDALAEALRELTTHPERYRELSTQAARAVRGKFSPESAIAALESHYRELVACGGRTVKA